MPTTQAEAGWALHILCNSQAALLQSTAGSLARLHGRPCHSIPWSDQVCFAMQYPAGCHHREGNSQAAPLPTFSRGPLGAHAACPSRAVPPWEAPIILAAHPPGAHHASDRPFPTRSSVCKCEDGSCSIPICPVLTDLTLLRTFQTLAPSPESTHSDVSAASRMCPPSQQSACPA